MSVRLMSDVQHVDKCPAGCLSNVMLPSWSTSWPPRVNSFFTMKSQRILDCICSIHGTGLFKPLVATWSGFGHVVGMAASWLAAAALSACCLDCWPCRCSSFGECRPLSLQQQPLSPLSRWSAADTALFMQSLGPDGMRQSCPRQCSVPGLFSARVATALEQRGLNGSRLQALLRRRPAQPSGVASLLLPGLEHAIGQASQQSLFTRRLTSALRQTHFGRPHALWLTGADGHFDAKARTEAVALLRSLILAGWSARVIAARRDPWQATLGSRGSGYGGKRGGTGVREARKRAVDDALAALAEESPSAVEFVEGLPCPNDASSVPLYTPLATAECADTPVHSLSAEVILNLPGCRALGSCAPCVPMAPRATSRRPLGIVFIEPVGADLPLLLHRGTLIVARSSRNTFKRCSHLHPTA